MAEVEKLIEIYQQLEDAGLMVVAGKKDTAELMVSHDVVPVVRCKDCKHTRKKNSREQFMYNENVYICTKEDIWGITKNEPVWDDGFCSYGERRTNG